MKLFLLATTLLTVVLTGAPVTVAQSGSGSQVAPPPQPLPPAGQSFDLGKVEGSTYTNVHFGISFTAPKGWTILEVGALKAMREDAKNLFRDEKDEKLKRKLEESVDRTTAVFSAAKLPPGTAGAFNALLMCAVEQVPTAIVKTPRDYYTLLLHSMKLSQEVSVEVVEPFQVKRIGATDFGIYTLKVTSNVGIVMQKHVLMVKGPYAFAMLLNYTEESDVKTFDQVISSIKAQ
jgi:hypothetical protein